MSTIDSTIDLTIVDTGGHSHPVRGFCDPSFRQVADAFAENFVSGEELGAAVCVHHQGRIVVDLWGGYCDAAGTRPWDRDTIVNMMSVSKGFLAVAIFMLLERGLVDIDAPVARYWPEFAAAGKADVPIRHVMDHRAGVPVLRPSQPRRAIYDWDRYVEALARQEPLWEPGTQAGYHILTMGFILGEIVRRVSGQSVGEFVRNEISVPLDLDYNIGLDPAEIERCADFVSATEGTIFKVDHLPDDELLKYAWSELPEDEDFNSDRWRKAQVPGANGHGNARSVSRLYAALSMGGTLDGFRLLTERSIERMSAEQHNLTEIVMKRAYHQGLGVLRNSPPISEMGPDPDAFGHHGVGGSIGFADRKNQIAFSYCTNRMHNRIDNGPRAGRLKRATYACLGFSET